MSTSIEHYVILGVNLGRDRSDEEQFEKLEHLMNDKEADLFCLFDGMNGGYVIVGKVLQFGNEYDGMDFKAISFKELNKIKKRVKESIHNEFGIEVEPELMMVSHFG